MPPKPPFTVRAVYEYTSDHDEDLTFTTGQVIVVNSLDGDEWYEGSYTDPSTGQLHQGMFPANFVEIYNTVPQTPARPKAESSTSASPPAGASKNESPAEPSHEYQDQLPSSRQPQANRASMSNETSTSGSAVKQQEPEVPAAADESTGYVGSFRDRIKAFNARHDAPPVPQANPKHSSFVKKPYVAPPSSYVPQPSPSAHKPSAPAPAPAVHPDFSATEPSSGEPEAPPVSSLKDRIALLQKTQLEQQAAAAKAKHMSHEKHHHHPHHHGENEGPGYESTEEEVESKEISDVSRQDTGGAESEPDYESEENQISTAQVEVHHTGTGSRRSIDSQRSGRKKSHEGNPELNDYTIAEKETVEEEDEVVEPERGRQKAAQDEEGSEQGEENEKEPSEGEEGDEIDPEVARKIALRERMAKMSGGMGMNFGMPMNMFAGPPGAKKPSKSKPSKTERTGSTSPPPAGGRASQEEETERTSESRQAPVPLFPVTAPPVPPSHATTIAPESDDTPQEPRESTAAVPSSSPKHTSVASSLHDRKRSSHAEIDVSSLRSESPASPRSGQKTASSNVDLTRDSEEIGLESKSPVRSVPPVPTGPPPIPVTSPRAPARASVDSQVSPISRAAPPVPGAAPPVPPTGSSRPPPIPTTRPSENLRASVSSGHSRHRSHEEEFHSPVGSPSPSGAPPPPPPAAVPPPIPKAVPPPSTAMTAQESDSETMGYDADEDTDVASSLHEIPAVAAPGAPPPPVPDASTRPTRPAPPPVPAAASPALPSRPPTIATAIVPHGENADLASPRSPHQRAPPPPPPTSPPRSSGTFPRHNVDPPKAGGVRRSSTMRESSTPSRSGISRASTDVKRYGAGQEQVPEEPLLSAHDLDLSGDGSEIWWVKPAGIPLAVRKLRDDVIYEIDDSSQTHRGGRVTRTRQIYILYPDYSQTEIVALYDESNPKKVKLDQVHTKSPDRPSPESLRQDYERFGIKAFDIASKLVGTEAPGNSGATSMIDLVIDTMPDVIKPIGNRTFGVCIYKNLGNSSVKQVDEIRPGDVVTIKDAKFSGHKGSLHQKYTIEIDDLSGGIVSEWDGSKKKLRIINLQQSRSKKTSGGGGATSVSGKVKPESFRLNDLKSGQIKVFRLVGRDYVGWDE